ncbi:hypothetical protein ACH427_03285 [Streptomyces sp. NPDC020379]|uniref:hypothetical protein n=1 Tax=Streptomyces sp. NPDC020379 TaxID=3365071 RepID=UPI00378C6510
MARPGYSITIEITELLHDQFPELDNRAVEHLGQGATPIVEFTPGRRFDFGRLARDLKRHHGRAVYVYPRRGGLRWVELVDAHEIAMAAQVMGGLARDLQERKRAKA